MDMLSKIIIIFIAFGFVFLLFKPKKQTKSKEQKQEEIYLAYLEKMRVQLSHIDNSEKRQAKKIILLQKFAKELEFNLFFDKQEVKSLIQKLAEY
ncbi:MAG TPA: hypothetical protein CFH79_08280 [Sulfurospirillum sp. UBA11407]|jgi:uncharacterized membrane protein YgaE (UPF0421/DUF939 family)|nr:MAG TPA: hypothetical protein CFH79_08280 [Sulfurospirillum sp. UBA11407]DAB34293.1 MAG TPA: hypothetical protein CFH82_06025 [Sulfurospirillum sp. UBA12182]